MTYFIINLFLLGFNVSAAQFLSSEKNVNGAGIDTLSLDRGNAKV